jgi:ubiquinone/menaquinone biosynthesis C-methylase UbiE
VTEVALLQTLGLDAESVLLELGAGTGSLALAAAAHCRRVIAVDVSPAMVALARQKVTDAGVQNVEVVEAGFLTYEHTEPPVDVVYSGFALHHLPDFWKVLALDRIARVLRPGGILRLRDLVFEAEPVEAAEVVAGWLDASSTSSDKGWTRAHQEEHVRDEHSTFSWLMEPMLERAGFEIRSARYGARAYADYVCVRSSRPD